MPVPYTWNSTLVNPYGLIGPPDGNFAGTPETYRHPSYAARFDLGHMVSADKIEFVHKGRGMKDAWVSPNGITNWQRFGELIVPQPGQGVNDVLTTVVDSFVGVRTFRYVQISFGNPWHNDFGAGGWVDSMAILPLTPVDTTAPTTSIQLSGQSGNNGWYVSNVQVSLTATDDVGVNKTEYSLNGGVWQTYTGPFTISAEGSTTISYRSSDAAGNVEAAKSASASLDKTAPAINIVSPVNDLEVLLGQALVADWSASDAGSGLASASGSTASGSALETGTAGGHSLNVVATDLAGNQAQETAAYYVRYGFSGILPPIKADGSSVFKLGRTVPVKFRLADYSGASIGSAEANIYLAKITGNTVGAEVEGASTSGAATGNLFRFDGTDDLYIFNLSTDNLSVGTWQIRIALNDGSSKIVNISLR